jgi:hypothetical protein
MAPTADVIDWDEAMQQCGDDEEFLRELLADLRSETETQLVNIEGTIAVSDHLLCFCRSGISIQVVDDSSLESMYDLSILYAASFCVREPECLMKQATSFLMLTLSFLP